MSWLRVLLSGVFYVCATGAHAQSSATADALFRQGRKASVQGDHVTACASFRESYWIEKAPGTLLNIAVCEEALGELAKAWQHYREVLGALPSGDSRVRLAAERLQALQPRVPRVSIRVTATEPMAHRITLDDMELSSVSLREPVPVDLGSHVLQVLRDGHAPRRYDFEIAEGQLLTLEVEAGEPLADTRATSSTARASAGVPVSSANPALANPSAPNEVVAPTDRSPVAAPNPWHQLARYAALGLGGAGLAASAITFGFAIDRKLIVDKHCPDRACDATGDRAARQGKDFVLASLLTLGVGVAGIGAGLYLSWITPDADTEVRAAPFLQRDAWGAQLQAAF